MRRCLFAAGLIVALVLPAPRAEQAAVAAAESLKFAVIGDNGDGSKAQYDVAGQLTQARSTFPFEFVIMLGDNMYGRQRPQDFVDKFARPYAPILQAKVPFYAAIGNHDSSATLTYEAFNMGGRRYYTFARKNARFFVLDTNLLDQTQVEWFGNQLRASTESWRIAYFHHPLYSDGDRHGSNPELRVLLEPLLTSHGVQVVFAAHDHIYSRSTPQKGIVHFVEGSSGRLRKGGTRPADFTAASFDQDQTFMLIEVVGDVLSFRTISRTGRVVDSGVIQRRPAT
jgi:predicted MPP superfamily phosphohydrolase